MSWPTYDDLFCWFLFSKWESVPQFHAKPEMVKEYLIEFRNQPPIFWHKEFHEQYKEFRDEFCHPNSK